MSPVGLRPCEVHEGFGRGKAATHRATYPPERFPITGKFRFDVCVKHAAEALHSGAVVVLIDKEDTRG